MDQSDLFLKNLAAFHDRAPSELFNRIARMAPPPLNLTGSLDEGTLNLNLGQTLLYNGDAATYAQGQISRYLAKPQRIYVNPPPLESDWVKGEASVYRATQEKFGPMPSPESNGPGSEPSAALISFGVGLGLHLTALLGSLRFMDLVLVEPYPEFLYMSFQAIDWTTVFQETEKRGGTVRFVVDPEPANLANGIFQALRQDRFALIDGTYSFRHYQSPTLDAASKLFEEMAPSLGASLGFVEDEAVMITNALANMKKPDARLIGPEDSIETGCPVLVVGSGPSLDSNIEDIRRLADSAIVIGAGTGTSALLEHGVTPDLHCEVENVAKIYDGFLILTDRHDLSDIPFFGSVTVDPRIPDLFGPTVYYFRDSVTSSLLLSGDTGILDHSAPTVANLACRVAVMLGASSIHLFGVDLGGADPSQHHSSASYYAWTEDEFWASGANTEALAIPVQGNFRETVYTNLAFLQTRTFFNAFCSAFRNTPVFNCSDGVKIEGASPCMARDIVSSERIDKSGIVSRLLNGTKIPNVATTSETVRSYREALQNFYAYCVSSLKCSDINTSYLNIFNALENFLYVEKEHEAKEDSAARACNIGTLILLLQFGHAYARRLPLNENIAFTEWYAGALHEHLDKMSAMMEQVLKNEI